MHVGGLHGCIIASCLARADPNLFIVLLDSGITNCDNPLVSRPGHGMFLANRIQYHNNHGMEASDYLSW
jgi:hypothetical protein